KASPAGIGDVGTWSCPPGVATATARTEYGRWRRTHRAADEGQFFVMFRPSVGEVASCSGEPLVRLLAVPGVTAAQRCVAIEIGKRALQELATWVHGAVLLEWQRPQRGLSMDDGAALIVQRTKGSFS